MALVEQTLERSNFVLNEDDKQFLSKMMNSAEIKGSPSKLLENILNNRMGLRLIFERFVSPGENFMSAKDLRRFFKYEQNQIKSVDECRNVIFAIAHSNVLTLADFYTLLEGNEFRIDNPIHGNQCQRTDKPLTHYYIATARRLQIKLAEEDAARDEREIISNQYRKLLLANCRHFQIKVTMKTSLSIPVQINTRIAYIQLDAFLDEVNRHAFVNSPNPIILTIDCEDICRNREEMEELFRTLKDYGKTSEVLLCANLRTECLLQPNFSAHRLPKLKLLQRKVVVFLATSNNGDQCSVNGMISSMDDFEASHGLAFEQLVEKVDSIDCLHSIHISGSKELIAQQANKLQESWPRITEKFLTSTLDHLDPPSIVEMIRVGIQSIPIDYEPGSLEAKCAKSLFELNGNSGFVLKPSALRHGKLYCTGGRTEDKPLRDEPKCGPSTVAVKVICGINLMPYQDGNMSTKVVIKVIGHEQDSNQFETSVCSVQGLIPYWNQQKRFRIGMLNFTFLHFEVINAGQTIGSNTLHARRVLSGTRFLPLYDTNGAVIADAKLYVNIDCQQIADNWVPSFDDV